MSSLAKVIQRLPRPGPAPRQGTYLSRLLRACPYRGLRSLRGREDGELALVTGPDGRPKGPAAELVDVVIRSFDAAVFDGDLSAEELAELIEKKVAYSREAPLQVREGAVSGQARPAARHRDRHKAHSSPTWPPRPDLWS